MLEIAILEILEALKASQPRISVGLADFEQRPIAATLQDAQAAGSIGKYLYEGFPFGDQLVRLNDDSAVLIGSAFSTPSPYKLLRFDPATETLSWDDSVGRGLMCVCLDNSGVVWGTGQQAGYYGLWRRTGASTWTQVLNDSAMGYIKIKTDGSLYYISSTANWYVLSNGAATLTAAQTVGMLPLYLNGPFQSSMFGDLPNAVPYNKTALWPRYAANLDGSNSLMEVPVQWTLAAGQCYGVTNIWAFQVRINETYSLVSQFIPKSYTANLLPGVTWGVHIYILNKSTMTMKWIGTIPNQCMPYGSADQATADGSGLRPVFAKWQNGKLVIYWIGRATANSASPTTGMNGVVKTSFTYSPDF